MRNLLIVLIGCAVFSCSKDEQPQEDSKEAFYLEAIIGSWSYETVKVNDELFIYPHKEGCEKDFFQFYNQEGKEFDFVERVILNCESCAECANSSTNLEWELKGEFIDLYFGDQFVLRYKLLNATENSIFYSVVADLDDDGIEDEYEFYAVRYDPFGNFD